MRGSRTVNEGYGSLALNLLQQVYDLKVTDEEIAMKKSVFAVLLAAPLALGLGAVQAQEDGTRTAAAVTADQIRQKLEGMGYTQITEIERDDGIWEVEATSPNGTRVDLDVDDSGKVLHEERDDD